MGIERQIRGFFLLNRFAADRDDIAPLIDSFAAGDYKDKRWGNRESAENHQYEFE